MERSEIVKFLQAKVGWHINYLLQNIPAGKG